MPAPISTIPQPAAGGKRRARERAPAWRRSIRRGRGRTKIELARRGADFDSPTGKASSAMVRRVAVYIWQCTVPRRARHPRALLHVRLRPTRLRRTKATAIFSRSPSSFAGVIAIADPRQGDDGAITGARCWRTASEVLIVTVDTTPPRSRSHAHSVSTISSGDACRSAKGRRGRGLAVAPARGLHGRDCRSRRRCARAATSASSYCRCLSPFLRHTGGRSVCDVRLLAISLASSAGRGSRALVRSRTLRRRACAIIRRILVPSPSSQRGGVPSRPALLLSRVRFCSRRSPPRRLRSSLA